jgi:hypothetical protein
MNNSNELQKDAGQNLWVAITPTERKAARRIAREQGMTFQGWLGRLVRQEIEKHQEHRHD